ncbi:MAG: alcohol dehydrogenase catalytic domain-containing protein [Limisphaerales bacterium]
MKFEIPDEMQAAVYRGVNNIRLETLPVPRIHAGDVLVKVATCGVCPTDIKKIQYGTVAAPRVFGHETSGTIVKVGAKVSGLQMGERVALHHHVPCLKCHACRHRAFAQCPVYKRTGITAGFEPSGGGYAEYARVMSFCLPGVVKIPKRNLFEEGAMLEPINTVLKAIRRLNVLRGDVVLVSGQGPIGLMFTKLLKLAGMKVVATDLMPGRLRLAKSFGAMEAVKPDSPQFGDLVDRLTKGRGLDAAIIAVPVDAAIKQATELLRGAGQLLLFAHTKRGAMTEVDLSTVCVDEKDLLGSYSADVTLQDEVAKLVFGRRIDVRKLISHRLPLSKTKQAVDLAAKPTVRSLKVLVQQER